MTKKIPYESSNRRMNASWNKAPAFPNIITLNKWGITTNICSKTTEKSNPCSNVTINFNVCNEISLFNHERHVIIRIKIHKLLILEQIWLNYLNPIPKDSKSAKKNKTPFLISTKYIYPKSPFKPWKIQERKENPWF